MSRRLPNLNQLRAFEAAARHLSFKEAAEELHVTHAAVSHQIKALEEDIGALLFQRMPRKVKLTPKGKALAPDLTRALNMIATAVSGVRDDALEGVLSISVAPFFGNRMVLPILAEFHAEFPGIRIRPTMNSEVVDLAKDDFDAAIRYGDGSWEGVVKVHLAHNMVAAFAAPSFIERKTVPLSLDDISSLPLGSVINRSRHWIEWFTSQGHDPGNNLTFIEYDNKARALDLALAGNGVALDDIHLMETEVAAGRLVQIHPYVHKQDTSMYLVYPDALSNDARLRAFGDWLAQRLAARPSPSSS
ncbi:LysR substrate-binding domain-containing protein [Boseongicola aestuarii]|uniref:Glycine cleavage system transcriptional activator n=1 Tax=Boseongicola aestuarii TaxID=1470561 RepID=A0A238J6G3_9RHOB|nr:LysR substrate-binding domain-containing protein [Boseongicola aestuarii]SMX25735.1 Glycine cleavage system transcriptional activator [Boseongicola aestuarii]